ncbi:glycosyltransferase [Shewanella livingstonensis]|uniref:Glycosyltransferase n=1 Tax=Shewanella livingstonensis TaxID=150120 RepID=A0A3G8LX08_9GAMM|nr:glycosyltransferase family 4 protein [Shewanella livingstonensis]AZG74179.1 glycosyltransferase [Shewanella livingstonensis]
MSILVVSNMYPSKEFPFYGTFVQKITEGLIDNGHDCKIVAISKIENKRFFKLIGYINFYINIIYSIIKYKPSCVYLHFPSHTGLPVLFIKLFRKFKIIAHFHGGDLINQSQRSKYFFKLKEIINNNVISKSELVVLPSNSFFNLISKTYKLKEDKVIITPSGGVDCDFFNFKSRVTRTCKILFVARLVPVKRPLLMSDCIKSFYHECPEYSQFVEVTVVGSGPLSITLKKELKGYNVKYLELASQKQLRQIYKENDILIQTSEYESLGLVPLEFMSTGGIAMCIDIPAFREYISSGENGFIFKDPSDFVRCMKKYILMDKLSFGMMSNQSRNTVLNRYNSCRTLKVLSNKLNEISSKV